MQPIVYCDTDYWEPFAKNVENKWVQDTKPDLIIASKSNPYAVGAASRLGSKIIKCDGDTYEYNGNKVVIGPSYKEIKVNQAPLFNSPILCIDHPTDVMIATLGLAFNHNFPVLALGEKPWGTFFYGGNFEKSRLYDIIASCSAVISNDRHLLMNCWGLGIPATPIKEPQDILDYMKEKKIYKVATRQEKFEEILQFTQ